MSAPSTAEKLEIIELVVRYAAAIDAKAYDELRTVFTPDAAIDYRQVGGLRAPFPEVLAWLPGAMARFEVTQHFVSNVRIEADGDALRARCYVRATHGYRKEGALVFFDPNSGEYVVPNAQRRAFFTALEQQYATYISATGTRIAITVDRWELFALGQQRARR